MSSVRESIDLIHSQLTATDCKLVAVTKTKPVSLLQQAYEAGCKRFGENRVQEMAEKQPQLPADIEWHLIGHLQTNKVKYIAPFVALIHSVDSPKLLEEIHKQAAKNARVIPCLLQIYIAQEETKFGLSFEEAEELFLSGKVETLTGIEITGLMGMATFTENREQIRREFRSLKQFFEKLKTMPLPPNVRMQQLSMGMSGDYDIAIEEGSTLIRVGSAIFGSR